MSKHPRKLVILVRTGLNESVRIDGGQNSWIDTINVRQYIFAKGEREELMKYGFPDPLEDVYCPQDNDYGRKVWYYSQGMGYFDDSIKAKKD